MVLPEVPVLAQQYARTNSLQDLVYDPLANAFGELGDPRAIPDLELLVSTDMQEFDAWGTGVGISIAEFARTAIKRIRRKAKRKKG
jgi:hypothetical protein